MKIIVSVCLLGNNVKYDGGNNKNQELIDFLVHYEVVKVCPEVMGGLSIPRIPAEIKSDRVINKNNVDVTDNYLLGAKSVLDIIKHDDIKIAILKDKSPSCGSEFIYDGTFSHKLIKGMGITTKLLRENGIIVLNENNYKDYFKGDKVNDRS